MSAAPPAAVMVACAGFLWEDLDYADEEEGAAEVACAGDAVAAAEAASAAAAEELDLFQ